MERLGKDEIFCIYERITNRLDKKSFSIISKKYLRVACLRLRSLYTKSPDLLFDILFASPKMLTFECHKPFSNNHMKLLADSCPNIEHLDLDKWYLREYHEMDKLEFDDIGLVAIANACCNLVDINLNRRLHFKEIGVGALVRSCKNLRKLSLYCCVNVTDKSLKMIGDATRLEMLDLRGCNMISDLGLEHLANKDLRYCLERLYLDKCDRITDNGIVHLKKLASLRNLGLSRCGVNITDNGVVALCDLPNLEMLFLDFLTNITDISLREIGSKCLKMLRLTLGSCEKITKVGLLAFSGHKKLNELSLVSCYKLSLEDIKPIIMSCQNMRNLYLSRSIKKPMAEPGFEEFFRVSGKKYKCTVSYVN